MNLLTKLSDIESVRRWAQTMRQVRHFFEIRDFVEIFTDQVVPAGAFEGTIDVLEVRFRGGHAELHTSPEIEMKRCLSELQVSIFQICKCFRDDPPTGIHLREFTMLEFYRVGVDYRAVIDDTRTLIEVLAGHTLPFRELSMAELVKESTGLDLAALDSPPALRAAIEGRRLCLLSPGDTWEDMFFKLLIEKVEPSLDPAIPTLVRDFPGRLAALGKINPANGLAERFEIYWHGMELCNGCTELEDIGELKRRFEKEQELRRLQGKEAHPFPERLVAAMSRGLPRCAGVAVGLDRLFRCLEIERGRSRS